MAILSREDYDAPKPVIDLTGPEGNAFMILGRASRLAKELDLDPEAITKEMTQIDNAIITKKKPIDWESPK